MSEPCPADITGTLQALSELGHGTEAARSFRQPSHTVFGPHLTREDRPRSPLGAPGTFVGFAFPALPRDLTHSGRPHEGWAAVAAFSGRRPSRAESGGFGTAARQPPPPPARTRASECKLTACRPPARPRPRSAPRPPPPVRRRRGNWVFRRYRPAKLPEVAGAAEGPPAARASIAPSRPLAPLLRPLGARRRPARSRARSCRGRG